MTWFPDLSRYSYLPESIPEGQAILNVGWLDSGHDFPVGDQIPLGSAEIRVNSADGTMLTAPNLVWHYVDYHRYLPPPEFVEAVLARREVK